MIKNVIFDMGNVLLRFAPPLFLDRMEITGEDRNALLFEVFQSIEWVQMDRGTLTEEEAVRRMCTRLPEHLHEAVHTLVNTWDQPLILIDGMEELAAELKAMGFRLLLLSNASTRQPEYWKRVPASRLFEDTLISAHVKLLKPQPEIYHLACEKFGMVPEECLFIDDNPSNCEAAVSCGWDAVIFHDDVSLLRRQLRARGIPVK